jgi:glycosyltransferase involved in cell wall biosynthesis
VWEKGHQDAIRAVAAITRGQVGTAPPVRLLIVGSGPEEARLRRHARDLGVHDRVELRAAVPYDEMPALYRSATCMVLASLPRRGWEEQFGMVLAEALASGTPVLAARSGAIPEVLDGAGELFDPGDWHGLARALAHGPLRGEPAARGRYERELVARYSVESAARRLADAYAELLSGAPILSRP